MSHIPFNETKVHGWNTLWLERFAAQYAEHPLEGLLPKVNQDIETERPGEPPSAKVIRALELQINGEVLSP